MTSRRSDDSLSDPPEGLSDVGERVVELAATDLLTDDPAEAFDAALALTFRLLVGRFAAARGRSSSPTRTSTPTLARWEGGFPFGSGPELADEREVVRRRGLAAETVERIDAALDGTSGETPPTRRLGSVYERLLATEPAIRDGAVRLVENDERRTAAGAYYTPESVVEYVVARAVDGRGDARVLDPAMGSGHFLIRAVDHLARARIEDGSEPAGSPEEVRREVAANDVFGVDVDPLAVELARAAVWLETGVWADDHLVVADALTGDGPDWFERGGFDAVVGNPPYVRSRHVPAGTKSDLRARYGTAQGSFDLYVPFVQRMTELGDRVCCVVPNKWTTARYGRRLRDLLLDRHRLVELLDASSLPLFPDANVYPLVVTVRSGEGPTEAIRVRSVDTPSLSGEAGTTLPRSLIDGLGDRVVPVGIDPEFVPIAERVRREHDRFGDHVTQTEGIHTGNVREKLVASEDGPDRERLVGGGAVSRYGLDWDGEWVRFDESLIGEGEYGGLRERTVFEDEKLLVRDICERPVAVHDDEGFYALNTLYSVRSREGSPLPLRYVLAVLNSTFAAAYFEQVYGGTHVNGGYLRFKPMFASQLPLPRGEEVRDALSALARRMADLRRERDSVPLSLPPSGDRSLGDLDPRRLGTDGILTETTETRDGLRLGRVLARRDGERVVLSATVRYRPAEGGEGTDAWGFVETDPIPALSFAADGDRRDLLCAFVPRAVADGRVHDRATKTISPLSRLERLRLPDPDDRGGFLDSWRRTRELDGKLARTDAAIDRLVYRAYGLSETEAGTVERIAGASRGAE